MNKAIKLINKLKKKQLKSEEELREIENKHQKLLAQLRAVTHTENLPEMTAREEEKLCNILLDEKPHLLSLHTFEELTCVWQAQEMSEQDKRYEAKHLKQLAEINTFRLKETVESIKLQNLIKAIEEERRFLTDACRLCLECCHPDSKNQKLFRCFNKIQNSLTPKFDEEKIVKKIQKLMQKLPETQKTTAAEALKNLEEIQKRYLKNLKQFAAQVERTPSSLVTISSYTKGASMHAYTNAAYATYLE